MIRTYTRWLSCLLLSGLLACSSVDKEEPQPSITDTMWSNSAYGYCPQLMTRTALEESVTVLPARAMHQTGKIYLWGKYIFINELYEGLHIVDNQDPSHPKALGFLRVPGNVDLAIQNNYLYVDNGPDLVTLDVSNVQAPRITSRVRNAFRELLPPMGYVAYNCASTRPENTIVVGWQHVNIPAPGGGTTFPSLWDRGVFFSNSAGTASAAPGNLTGKSGSLARFTILNQMLYTVDNQSLRLFDLRTPASPVAGAKIELAFGVETIFPYDHYLFLGTQRGMYIFDAATPQAPRQVSYYQHVVSCDPVVVDGKYAYVTLRSGQFCGGGPNQLQVIDLTSLDKPRLAQTYPMTGPQGLGVDNGQLFVCDSDGLKTFSTQQTPQLTLQEHFKVKVTDVIPHAGLLLAIGADGLYQYRYTGTKLEQLSLLPITPLP
ncbi:hypothetical protein MUN82_03665 [Hymenobacter aerilatus]|uniref:LVIVD repeat-containing protein n=1 Tax=Hymenobacter aerilatus TaxID=2932251 RepID=A0A8T9SVV4_9BACT|nr:hypothetical protein [Hymenobacter aerilatus]UOR06198.1 hypothetical protein MUN82_03665 [Hymenobacter aerilatus]